LRGVIKSTEYKPIDYNIIKRLLGFLKPYKKYVTIVILISISSTALGPLRPYLIKLVIDEHIANNDWQDLIYFVILIFRVLLLHSVFQFFITYIMQLGSQKVLFDLRKKIL